MAQEVINLDNSDNGGEDVSYIEQTATTLKDSDKLFHYTNGFGSTSVDVTFTGSRAGDDDFSEGIDLNTESLSSGASGYFVLTEPWEKVQITLSPGSDPTSGSFTLYRSDDN